MPAEWEQRKGESPEAYAAFLVYRDCGKGRSLIRAYEKHRGLQGGYEGVAKNAPGNWQRWSKRWKWETRVTAWEVHLQRERDKIRAKEIRKWEARKATEHEQAYQFAMLLRKRATQMLSFPLAEEEIKTEQNGRVEIRVIKPGRWTYKDALNAVRISFELAAAATMAHDKDPDDMPDAEVDAVSEEPGEEGEDSA